MNISQPTILVVEDNVLNLELVSDLLAAEGYTVRQARNGDEGLSLARSEPPSLILMDLRMPGMDGYAALHALREDPRTAHIPTVALTAQAMSGDKEDVLAAGFDGYISKPIDTRTFCQTVARVLSSK